MNVLLLLTEDVTEGIPDDLAEHNEIVVDTSDDNNDVYRRTFTDMTLLCDVDTMYAVDSCQPRCIRECDFYTYQYRYY